MKYSAKQNGSFFRIFVLDLKRAVLSIRFLLGIVFFVIWMVTNIAYELLNLVEISEWSTVYLLRTALDAANLGPVLLVISAVPFSTVYLQEKESGFMDEVCKRVGICRYGVSKALVTFLSDFLLAITGIFLFIIILDVLGVPHTVHNDSFAIYYEELVISKGVYWYYAVKTVITGFVCGLAGVFSLMISSYFSSTYVAVLSPVIAFYLWNSILNLLYPLFPSSYIWYMISPNNLFFAQVWLGSSLASMLWTVTLMVLLSVLAGICFIKKVCTEEVK